jgi:hypothetical protein
MGIDPAPGQQVGQVVELQMVLGQQRLVQVVEVGSCRC